MAAGLCPQATLEEEFEEVLGLEASRGGRKLPFGQELGRDLLAAAGIGDQHGPPADHEGVLVAVGWEAVQGVTAVAVQVLAFGGGVQEPQQRILGNQRAHWMQPGTTVSADGRQEPSPTPNWYSSRRPASARSGRRRWSSAQDTTGARSGIPAVVVKQAAVGHGFTDRHAGMPQDKQAGCGVRLAAVKLPLRLAEPCGLAQSRRFVSP